MGLAMPIPQSAFKLLGFITGEPNQNSGLQSNSFQCVGELAIQAHSRGTAHIFSVSMSRIIQDKQIFLPKMQQIWIELSKRSYLVVSPAMASNVTAVNSWMEQFFKASPTPKVDYIAVHHYGANVTRLKEYLTDIYNDKVFNHKPIWLTQFAAQDNQKSTSNPLPQSTVNTFIEESVRMLKSLPFVHRYAWHSASSGTSALYDASGQLTQSGRKYASM